MLMLSALPFLFMIIMSVLLVTFLLRSRRKMNNQSMRREYQLTFTIISLNVYFLLMNFPYGLMRLLKDMEPYESDPFAIFLYQMSVMIKNIYFTMQFFIHLSTNKIFYRKFISILLQREFKAEMHTASKSTNPRQTLELNAPIK